MTRVSILVLASLFSSACVLPANSDDGDAGPRDGPSHFGADSLADSQDDGLGSIEQLGKALFEDTRLSEPSGVSCASCHVPLHAFSGNNESSIGSVSLGSRAGQFGARNAPTAMYAFLSPPFGFVVDDEETKEGEPPTLMPQGGQFWDGRASTLEQQAQGPFLNVHEMNNGSASAVIDKLKSAPYHALWDQVYGARVLDQPTLAFERAADAIAAFERSVTFARFSSKFDQVLRGEETFSPQEQRGYNLFVDPQKGNCIACHAGDPKSRDPRDWPFTDFTYDNLGLPRNRAIPANADPNTFDLGLCRQPGLTEHLPDTVSMDSLCGAFKVPTLRNIALTAPYGHNGVFTELRDMLRFYVTRDTSPELWYPRALDGGVDKYDDLPPPYRGNVNEEEVPYDRKLGETPRLNDAELDDLLIFLQTLTDR